VFTNAAEVLSEERGRFQVLTILAFLFFPRDQYIENLQATLEAFRCPEMSGASGGRGRHLPKLKSSAGCR